jgi:hypothetical protein
MTAPRFPSSPPSRAFKYNKQRALQVSALQSAKKNSYARQLKKRGLKRASSARGQNSNVRNEISASHASSSAPPAEIH